jgi:hypothetical protein
MQGLSIVTATARPRITPQRPCASVCRCASSMQFHAVPYTYILRHTHSSYTQLLARRSVLYALSVPASSPSLCSSHRRWTPRLRRCNSIDHSRQMAVTTPGTAKPRARPKRASARCQVQVAVLLPRPTAPSPDRENGSVTPDQTYILHGPRLPTLCSLFTSDIDCNL